MAHRDSIESRTHGFRPGLPPEDAHMVHSHGSAATTHTEDDMELAREACRRVARRVNPYP